MSLGHRSATALAAAGIAALALVACSKSPVTDAAAHRAEVDAWHAKRVERLTSETGWLTLVGLYWLKPGENTFGRAPNNAFALDHAALPDTLGSFYLEERDAAAPDGARTVRFTARPGAEVVTLGRETGPDGAVVEFQRPVDQLTLLPDAAEGGPTVLQTGTLRFHVIERAGRLGIRIRDTQHPLRTGFAGIERWPVSPDWVFDAEWVPYDPPRPIKIGTIIGTVEEMPAWGQVRFRKGFTTYALDAVLEVPGDTELFVMFKDDTSGRETYGAGRFMYIPIPKDPTKPGTVRVDFNRAYNPPCAFNEFATCPLPPQQNWLTGIAVEAGEKDYGRH
jgi:uncharacterized protein (DUF1684 family)